MSAAVQNDVLLRLDVKDLPVRPRDLGQVTTGRVQDALGLGGRARGVHHVQRVLRVVRLRCVLGRLPGHRVVPPHVTALGPVDFLAGAPHHENGLDVRAVPEGLVHRRLQRDGAAAAVPAVGGDDRVRVTVENPGAERVCGEPAEDHHVRRPEAGTGEHRDHGFRDHRHVDGHPVALAHAQLGERVGGPAYLVFQFGVGDHPLVARLAFPVVRDPVAEPGGHMPVHAVDGRVELAAGEPLGERGPGPVKDLVPRFIPGKPLGFVRPEGEAVARGLRVNVGRYVSVRGQFRWRVKPARFSQQVGKSLFGQR